MKTIFLFTTENFYEQVSRLLGVIFSSSLSEGLYNFLFSSNFTFPPFFFLTEHETLS